MAHQNLFLTLLTLFVASKFKWKMDQMFVAFSEFLNFNIDVSLFFLKKRQQSCYFFIFAKFLNSFLSKDYSRKNVIHFQRKGENDFHKRAKIIKKVCTALRALILFLEKTRLSLVILIACSFKTISSKSLWNIICIFTKAFTTFCLINPRKQPYYISQLIMSVDILTAWYSENWDSQLT